MKIEEVEFDNDKKQYTEYYGPGIFNEFTIDIKHKDSWCSISVCCPYIPIFEKQGEK